MSLIVRFVCCDKKKIPDIRILKRRDFIWLTVLVMVEAGAWRCRASDFMEARKEKKHVLQTSHSPLFVLPWPPPGGWCPPPRIHHGSLPLVLSGMLSQTHHSLIFNTTDNNKTMIRRASGCLYTYRRHTAPSESTGPFVGSSSGRSPRSGCLNSDS